MGNENLGIYDFCVTKTGLEIGLSADKNLVFFVISLRFLSILQFFALTLRSQETCV
jgi:hypothetical protein